MEKSNALAAVQLPPWFGVHFVRLTIEPKKIESYFRAQDILAIQRDDENQIETIVVVLTPKGAQPFKVAESCAEVASAVEKWYKSQCDSMRR